MNTTEQLDPNMTMAEVRDGLRWYDLRAFGLEGQGWRDVERPYCRLPAKARTLVPEPVWNLAQHSAGLCFRFCTDAPELTATWRVLNPSLAMDHMPATGVSGLDLYTRHEGRWRWIGVGRPTSQHMTAVLARDLPRQMREYRLYLPLYNGVEQLQLGLAPDSKITAAPALPRQRPVCFYGTSIVHGGCASRPGMSHVAILGRRLDCPAINLGFSGNGRMEMGLAHLLAELDPAAYILDCLPNLQEPLITARTEPFVQILREARPTTPIVLVESAAYGDGYLCEPRRSRYAASNAALRRVYERLRQLPQVYYIPLESLLGDDFEGTVDGTHPTDAGFLQMADAMMPVLQTAIG